MSTQDFVPSNTFNQGLQIAVETDQRGEAPSGNNQFWFQGGKWVQLITQDLPSLYDQQETIFPAGHAGKRSMNTQPPIRGRTWSEGGFSLVVTSENLGHIIYGSLGTASHNTVPSTDIALLAASAPEAAGNTFALTTQPSDGGARLQLVMTGNNGSGRLTVAGTDAENQATSETISFDLGPTTMYTRTSFSAVDGITFDAFQTDAGGASLAVNGVSYWEHTFTVNETADPTFSIERIGDPTAGAASKSNMHVGMVLRSFTLDSPAEARDGIITIETDWEGDPTATCTAKNIQDASSVRIWPAWILSLTRDNAVYNRATNFALTLNTGNRNYRSAAGVQTPQGSFFGGREATGAVELLLSDETEFNRWRGASRQSFRMTWDSPWKLTSTKNEGMEASVINAYLETVDTSDNDGMYMYSGDFRMTVDSTNDIAAFKLFTGIPAEAYGGSTVLS